MLDKMKKHKRLVLITGIGIIAVIIAIVLLVSYLKKGSGYTFSDFEDDYDTKQEAYISKDSQITFDGSLNDAAWEGKRWLEVEHSTDESIQVRMTSYFGEDGLYMAFDVNDVAVYYDKHRDVNANSGIQLYLSSLSGAKDITGYGYEITLNVGGEADIKIYKDDSYIMTPGTVYLASDIKGELNSPNCEGYTLETFIDYKMLGGETEAVYANPAIIRSFSVDNDERQWYSFGEEIRGAAWTQADTWWTFDKDGLVAYDVSIQAENGGQIKGKAYAVHGDDYTFEVTPKEGFYAVYVLINNQNVTEDLYYQSGKTCYTVEGAEEDLEIKATFAEIPSKTIFVSGKVNDGKTAVSGAKVWAIKNGYVQAVSVDAEGNYSATIPAIEGLGLLVEADGYVSAYSTAKEGVNNIVLRKEYFGDNESVKRSSSNVKLWDLSRIYEDRVRAKSSEFGIQLVNSEIYSNSVYVSANVITEAEKGVDTRAGFTFYKDADTSVIIAVTMSGEISDTNPDGDIFCDIQLITVQNGKYVWRSGGTTVPFENQEEIIKAATSESGIPMAVHYCNGMFDVWVNGEQVGFCIYPANEKGQNILETKTKMAVGLECWSTKAVYENLKFEGNYSARKAENIPGWDLSKVNEGTVKSLTDAGWTQAMLTTEYSDKISISANIPLPLQKGKDWRAGFYFKNQKGEDVFVALTMNGEVNANNPEGKLFYSIQMISKEFKSWSYSGDMEDISTWNNVKSKATTTVGVPMTVYVENGKFTLGIDGYIVAKDIYPADENGKNILEGNTSLMVGVATAGKKADFTNIKIGDSKPRLMKKIDSSWDISKLAQGEVLLTEKTSGSSAMLWPELKNRFYITSNIVLAPAGEDVREGYRFEDKSGNSVFVALLCEADGRYMIQVITKPVDGDLEWLWVSPYISEDYGISKAADTGVVLDVAYDKGVLNMWINNRKIGTDIKLPFKTEVTAGLECWNTVGKFYQLEVFNNWQ